MNIHEYQAKSVLEKYGVRVQRGVVVDDASQALEAAKKLQETTGTGWFVVKAQIHAGGRGKGLLTSGLKGGVKICKTPVEVENYTK